MHSVARVHEEQSWFHLFSLPAFHRDLASPRYDEPRVIRRRMHVYLLSLPGRQRNDYRAKLIADVHPARALLFRVRNDAPTVILLHALMSASDQPVRPARFCASCRNRVASIGSFPTRSGKIIFIACEVFRKMCLA